MLQNYDLHSHSTYSDGALSPTDLIQRAKTMGVSHLALTDHDTTAGLTEAKQAALEAELQLISGIELSTTWQNKTLHVVGLRINPDHPSLSHGLGDLQATRFDRAEKIAQKLEKKRLYGALDVVQKLADQTMITRSHFADFLFSQGHVSSLQEAFDKYLGKGKPAYVAAEWIDLTSAIGWIVESGGVAVLAHPMRYQLTATVRKRLLKDFKEAGGQAIEVVTGRSNPEESQRVAKDAKAFELYASVGSDFHNPALPWVELGRLAALPKECKPVWELWS